MLWFSDIHTKDFQPSREKHSYLITSTFQIISSLGDILGFLYGDQNLFSGMRIQFQQDQKSDSDTKTRHKYKIVRRCNGTTGKVRIVHPILPFWQSASKVPYNSSTEF